MNETTLVTRHKAGTKIEWRYTIKPMGITITKGLGYIQKIMRLCNKAVL